MAGILKPFSNRLNPNDLPIGALRVDTKHPLAQGLLACYVPAVTRGNNLAIGGLCDMAIGITANPPDWTKTTAEGPGMATSQQGVSSGLWATATGPFIGLTNASMYWRGALTAAPTNNGYVIGLPFNLSGSTPFSYFTIFQNSAAFTFNVGWNEAGTFHSSGASPAVTANSVVGVGATIQAPSGNAVGYLNGLAWASTATTGALTSSNPPLVLQSLDTQTASHVTGVGLVGYFWNRTLSAQEMAFLDRYPYDFLIAPEHEMPAIHAQTPLGSVDWPLPAGWIQTIRFGARPQQNEISFFNPTQMNTGLKPAGADYTDLPQLPGVRDPRQPDRNWERFYNPTQMATGARPSGAQSWDLSPRQPPPRPDETWTWFYNPTQMNTGLEPFFQTDWPIPTYKPRPDETWTWNYNPTYMNTGAKPAGAQSLDLSPRQPPPRPDETWTWFYNPTQMQTGLKPFLQVDWPIPTAGPRPDATWVWPGITSVAFPLNQYDWPLPGMRSRLDATWIDFYNPAQMQTGAFPSGAQYYDLTGRPPRPDLNWISNPLTFITFVNFPRGMQIYDLPARPPRPDATWIWFYNPTQMNTGANPFFQTDWPLPNSMIPFRPSFNADIGAFIPNISILMPLPQQWDLPTPQPRMGAYWDWSTPIGYFPSAVSYPVNQYDWPLPGRYPRPDETWVSFYNPTQMQTGLKPFAQIDWPLPIARPRLDATWTWPGITSAVVFPVNQYDWPLPTRAPLLVYGGNHPRLYGPGIQPFNQLDWPLPTPRFRPTSNWDWPTPASYPIAFPFFQTDWPLPGRYPRQDATWLQFYNPTQMQTGQKPFLQLDWPLPPRGYFRIEQTTSQFYNPTQMVTGTKPFAQTEWPLPTPPNYGNLIHYTITGANNPNIYTPPAPTTVKIEWLIRARRRGRR